LMTVHSKIASEASVA